MPVSIILFGGSLFVRENVFSWERGRALKLRSTKSQTILAARHNYFEKSWRNRLKQRASTYCPR